MFILRRCIVVGQHNIFWDWFLENIDRIETYQSGEFREDNKDGSISKQDQLLDDLIKELHYYNDNLYFEISTQESINEFIVTADGDVEQFFSVHELVSRAPTLSNWKFTAFKAGVGFGFYTQHEGVKYDPGELWFLPIRSKSTSDNLALRIGIPNFSDIKHEYSEEAMWIILETALGELECAKSIQYVEVGSLPHKPDEKGYIELPDLKDFIDWYKENPD